MEQISSIFTAVVCVAGIICVVLLMRKLRQQGREQPDEKKQARVSACGTTGMGLGVAIGAVLSMTGIISTSYGVCFGMLIGLTAGTYLAK
ncbi:hypothetical protein [Butyricicoccus sp.]|uniref:hypothetical protein n=1 Tax=Butyricicoccus sp. TaxID=2049021 RepID=UPI003736268B